MVCSECRKTMLLCFKACGFAACLGTLKETNLSSNCLKCNDFASGFVFQIWDLFLGITETHVSGSKIGKILLP